MEQIASISKKIIYIGFALLFILVPLILTPWNYELFEYNKMMVTYGLTAVIVGAWIVRMIATHEIRIRKTPLDIPIFLFVLSQFISTLFSMDPHVSWFGYYSRFNGGMFSVLTYIALYYAFVTNFTSQSEHSSEDGKNKKLSTFNLLSSTPTDPSSIVYRLLKIILITGLIVSLYGVAEHFGIDKNIWVQDVQNRVFSTLGQPNWLAAYLIAIIPLAMGFGLKSQISSTKPQTNSNAQILNKKNVLKIWNFGIVWNLSFVIWILISIIFFITLLWTRSRSGFFALLVADVVFWGILFFQTWKEKHKKKISLKDPLVRPFLFIHSILIVIIMLNGVYVKQIDDWVTISAWTNRISKFTPNTIYQIPPSGTPSSAINPESTSATNTQSNTPKTQLIETGVTESGTIRKYVWQGALNAWRSSTKATLIGTGTETFAFAFYQYKPVGHNLTSEWDFLYNKAHNEYLNFLATTGILGLGTYVLLIVSFIIWFIKVQIIPLSSRALNGVEGRRDLYKDCFANARNDIIMIGLFAGWISILITNFFGFSVVIMQIFFYLFPAFIFVLSREEHDKDLHHSMDWTMRTKKILIGCITAISILLVGTVCISWISDKQFANGYHLSRAGYMPQAYESLASAISLNPAEPMFHDEQGNVLASLALAAWKEQQATTSQELASMSIKENDAALIVSPKNVNFWKSRTKIFYALSSIDPALLQNAIQALEQGLTLSPQDPKMYYNLSILYAQAGQTDTSLEFMKKTIELKPNYREGYAGLSVLYKEQGMTEESRQIIEEYLTNVDPNDEEFIKLIK